MHFQTARISYHHSCCIIYLYIEYKIEFDPRFDSVTNIYPECNKTTSNLLPSQRKVNMFMQMQGFLKNSMIV